VLSAIGLCLETTFDAYATREGLGVLAWVATVHGTLDRTPLGARFTRIVAHVEVTVDADTPDLAHALLARAEKACIVTNLLKVPVELEANISAERRTSNDDVC